MTQPIHHNTPPVYPKHCTETKGILPRCSYAHSRVVKRTLRKYEGVDLVRRSIAVFPKEDNTTFPTISMWSEGNALMDTGKVRYVVSKFMEPLEERYPK